MTETDTYDFFNPPLKHKIPKEIKLKGDAKHCSICNADTIYSNTPCAICGLKNEIQQLRFAGKQASK